MKDVKNAIRKFIRIDIKALKEIEESDAFSPEKIEMILGAALN
jgi:hypothetical protein